MAEERGFGELEETGEPEEEEQAEHEFDELDPFEKEETEDITPEEEFEAIVERLKKLAHSYKAANESSNDAYNKTFIELFGKQKDAMDYGIEGRIDHEFRYPSLSGLLVARYWSQFQERNKALHLQHDSIKEEQNRYIKEYVDCIKELLRLYLEMEKRFSEAVSKGVDEKEVIKTYFGSLNVTRQRELNEMYDKCNDVMEFKSMVNPYQSDLEPVERMWLRVLNRMKEKFWDSPIPGQKKKEKTNETQEQAN